MRAPPVPEISDRKCASHEWRSIGLAHSILANAIGPSHSAAILIKALRESRVASTAAAFTSYGRGGFAWRDGEPVRFPGSATKFPLPPEFWSTAFHQADGCRIWADWEAGNFSWLDGIGSSAGDFGRSATGVIVSWTDALVVMAPYVDPAALTHSAPRAPGRPAGTRQFPSDQELAQEAAAMLKAGEATSATDAARRLIHRAGGASDDAKVRRLRPLISAATEIN